MSVLPVPLTPGPIRYSSHPPYLAHSTRAPLSVLATRPSSPARPRGSARCSTASLARDASVTPPTRHPSSSTRVSELSNRARPGTRRWSAVLGRLAVLEDHVRPRRRLDVARVAGNFHASVHAQSYAVLQTLLSKEDLHGRSALNMSHTIDALSFGPEYPGVVNPLDGAVRIIEDETDLHGSTKYARAARLLVWAPADISTLPWPKSSLTADASARARAVDPPLALPLAFRKVLPQARADDVRVRPGRRSRV